MITAQDLAQALLTSQKIQDKRNLELQESQDRTDKQMKETDRQMKETAERFKETDKLIQALSKNIVGVSKSVGLETEEFFFTSFQKNPTLANLNFDFVYRNNKTNLKGKTQEIDIMLENGNSVGVVEVKNKVTQKSIDQLDKIMEEFFFFHSAFKGYKLVGALAGKIFPEQLQAQALKKGYSVITQQGDHMEQVNP